MNAPHKCDLPSVYRHVYGFVYVCPVCKKEYVLKHSKRGARWKPQEKTP